MQRILVFIWLCGFGSSSLAALKSEEIDYRVGDTAFTGYLVYDDAIKGKRPGVLVVHEWWGLNGYARKRADMLAQLGYTAFALDMYGSGKVADHPDDAKGFMQAVTADMQEAEKRFDQAQLVLQHQPTVRSGDIAAIGYCFGGGIVLHMARAGDDLSGVVSFHGSLGTTVPAAKDRVTAKILVFTGAADPFSPAATVAGFEREMRAAGVDYRLVSYPGVKHSFTNPEADSLGARFNMPLAYDRHADEDSWEQTRQFLARLFKH